MESENSTTNNSSSQSWGFFGEENSVSLEEDSDMDSNFGFFDDTADITPTSEIKVSMVIDEKYAELAVRGLHAAYELDK